MILRLTTGAAMIVAAALLLLVAHDAWHWSRAMRDGDARAALGPVTPQAWTAQTTLPSSWTRGLLGIDDDISFRQTMAPALYQPNGVPTAEAQRQRVIIESALVRASRSDTDPARASQAADTLGVLFYYDPPTPANAQNPYQSDGGGPSGALSPSVRALAEFQLAVRLDPNNANAQKNLEILLREIKPAPSVQTTRAGAGDQFGNKGSGSRLPGHGY